MFGPKFVVSPKPLPQSFAEQHEDLWVYVVVGEAVASDRQVHIHQNRQIGSSTFCVNQSEFATDA